ncbi:MAG TPA: pyruvate dehydrogenase (acetyl-transferring) E1 component subunit alpha, partial [Pyrinomonadaceae bacterium]|nr:pyruvate dehydrogenase (acetyl-transferring) E1 component subunit alpha [Pyrinomonadaceae bacterium]
YQMILIRRFEEKSAEAYTLGKIGGFCHLYIGQEAVAVGSIAALRDDDYVMTSYRDHGHALARGTSPDEVMAELFGKAGGCSAGKGGSMHLFDRDHYFLGGHGIVGGQIPLATGVAAATAGESPDMKASGVEAPEVSDEINPSQLRQEHEERVQHQEETIERVDRDTLLRMLYQMILIRRFEEKSAEAYTLGKIGGFCHLYIGQEAVAVGVLSALRQDDYVLTSYRDHGHALILGTSPDEVMAELYGKAGGCSAGKGGSMHLFDADNNFLGGHAIVGGQIPLATGVAFASKYRGTDQVAVCFFGEAAVNQGAFHESLNMAQLWKLPCIYICENNQYGMGTAVKRAMSLHDVVEKACAYDMASEFVDGMDVLAVRAATERAVERARKESLPSLLEIRTYRFMGHSMSDPGHYRTRAEIEQYQERDPIKVFGRSLREKGVLDDAGLKEIEDRVRAEVERSVKFADSSPEPAPEELFTQIYATEIGKK